MAKPESRIRVMTWNIHKGIGGLDRRYDLGRTISVLQHYQPDILMLQEVAREIPRARQHDQAELLAQALGFHGVFAMEHQFRAGAYGNLILARWPIFDPTHLDLTIGSRKKRGLIQGRVRVHTNGRQQTVVVHNMHLGLAGRERGPQLDRFISFRPFRNLHRSTPVIVGGDLNDLWGSLGAKYLVPSGFARAGALSNTFPSALPLRPLDGLYFRGKLQLLHCEVAHSRIARLASDHLPIYADFELLRD
jgi:endonuclease/exonuclease/phosphatase family metal-dependent hydrolase